MPSQSKYQRMCATAMETNQDSLKDLPALECGHCEKLVSFGGIKTFQEGNFKINDICNCCELVPNYIKA